MAAFRNSASDASSHPVLTEYQSDLHRFAHQAAIRVEQDRQVALRQDGQELPEPLGGTLIESALPSNPLVGNDGGEVGAEPPTRASRPAPPLGRGPWGKLTN